MEQKLSELRNRRRREQIWEIVTLKGVMEKIKIWPKSDAPDTVLLISDAESSSDPEKTSEAHGKSSKMTPKTDFIQKSPKRSFAARSPSPDNISIVSNTSTEFSFDTKNISRLTLITYLLYTLLWFTTWFIAIELRFGAVYVVISGLFFIYFNTRTGPRKEGEVSAYSVFNPNCEAIDGALKPEQFEKEFNLIHYSPT